jgi:C_GCAxxG_C_C family probable redox protein
MLSKEEVVRRVAGYAEDDFLCSEAVLMALSECLGVSSEIIPRIATGFGAGVGRKGEVCGALLGGVMGLGLRFGRSTADEGEGERRPYWLRAQ